MKNITVLFPGGFKPITGAHLELANRYAAHPQVDRVIMLCGPKSRDGITREKTIELFNLLNKEIMSMAAIGVGAVGLTTAIIGGAKAKKARKALENQQEKNLERKH